MSQIAFDIANKNLHKVIALCYEMLELADYGDKHRSDDGCGVVYGFLRDAAYKVRRMAENEMSNHGMKKNDTMQPLDKETKDE